jgi:hypothetical protein
VTKKLILIAYIPSKGTQQKTNSEWGHGDLNAGHRTPSPVGYQATLWPRAQVTDVDKAYKVSHSYFSAGYPCLDSTKVFESCALIIHIQYISQRNFQFLRSIIEKNYNIVIKFFIYLYNENDLIIMRSFMLDSSCQS